MPFDDVADFAAGVCASAIKAAENASTSPTSKVLRKFILAFVFRTGRRVQSHQCWSEHAASSPLHSVHKKTARAHSTSLRASCDAPYLKRDPSTALCQMRVRNRHNRRSCRPPRRRGQRYGNCSASTQAPARGLRTRNRRRCDALRARLPQRPCHIGPRKLRIQAYTIRSCERKCAAMFVHIRERTLSGWSSPQYRFGCNSGHSLE